MKLFLRSTPLLAIIALFAVVVLIHVFWAVRFAGRDTMFLLRRVVSQRRHYNHHLDKVEAAMQRIDFVLRECTNTARAAEAANMHKKKQQERNQDDNNPSARSFVGKSVALPFWPREIQRMYGARSLFGANPQTIDRAGVLPFIKKPSTSPEDALIYEIFGMIGERSRYFVDLGFDGDSLEEAARTSPAVALRERGWLGALLSGGHVNESINLHDEYFDYSNTDSILREHRVPLQPDLMAVDVNNFDWFVTLAALKAGYRPRVFSLKYQNSWVSAHAGAPKLPPPIVHVDPTVPTCQYSYAKCGAGTINDPPQALTPRGLGFKRVDCASGSSPTANVALMRRYGYGLVASTDTTQFFALLSELPAGTVTLDVNETTLAESLAWPMWPNYEDDFRSMGGAVGQLVAVWDMLDANVLLRGGTFLQANEMAEAHIRFKYLRKSRCWKGAY